MSAYVELQQAEFADADRGYTAVKHQAEVGTGYFDKVATALNPTSGTLALMGSTEERAVQLSRRAPVACGRRRRRKLWRRPGPDTAVASTRSTRQDFHRIQTA